MPDVLLSGGPAQDSWGHGVLSAAVRTQRASCLRGLDAALPRVQGHRSDRAGLAAGLPGATLQLVGYRVGYAAEAMRQRVRARTGGGQALEMVADKESRTGLQAHDGRARQEGTLGGLHLQSGAGSPTPRVLTTTSTAAGQPGFAPAVGLPQHRRPRPAQHRCGAAQTCARSTGDAVGDVPACGRLDQLEDRRRPAQRACAPRAQPSIALGRITSLPRPERRGTPRRYARRCAPPGPATIDPLVCYVPSRYAAGPGKAPDPAEPGGLSRRSRAGSGRTPRPGRRRARRSRRRPDRR